MKYFPVVKSTSCSFVWTACYRPTQLLDEYILIDFPFGISHYTYFTLYTDNIVPCFHKESLWALLFAFVEWPATLKSREGLEKSNRHRLKTVEIVVCINLSQWGVLCISHDTEGRATWTQGNQSVCKSNITHLALQPHKYRGETSKWSWPKRRREIIGK